MRGAEHKRRIAAAEARARGEFVGFVACPHGHGRILKVALPDTRRNVRVRCPVGGCTAGEHETGNAMARPRLRGEVCDLTIDGATPADPADVEPDAAELEAIEAEDAPAPRRRISDEAVLAAVPTTKAAAHEVAATLGYGATTGLVRRLERINQRATEAGEDAPFVIAKQGHGFPTEVRRAA